MKESNISNQVFVYMEYIRLLADQEKPDLPREYATTIKKVCISALRNTRVYSIRLTKVQDIGIYMNGLCIIF